MKRIILLLASLALAANTFAADKLKVVTATEDLASLTREVGGDRGNVTAIGKGYQDPHLNAVMDRINCANQSWVAQLAPFRGTKTITYHRSWLNFAKHVGLDTVDTVEPKPGIPPSPSHTLDLINLSKREGVKAIIMEP